MNISCILIEDEPLALRQTREFIMKVPYLELLECFENGLIALDFIKNNTVELIFLDVQMDEISGIQLLESMKSHPKVIITTAFERYALKGYELDIIDYLLKPFTFDRFLQAVEKVHCEILKESRLTDYCFIKTEHRLEKVTFNNILFIEGMRDYRRIFMTDKKIMTLQTFTELEQMLPDKFFCRVHKSYIVSIGKIDSIEKERIKIGDKLIPVSESYKGKFYNKIKR